jgi:hypothetical protein
MKAKRTPAEQRVFERERKRNQRKAKSKTAESDPGTTVAVPGSSHGTEVSQDVSQASSVSRGAAAELVTRALVGDVDRAWVRARLFRESVDPKNTSGARVSALRALDDLCPPDPPKEDGSAPEPTPAMARAAFIRVFGDDVLPPPLPEVPRG